MYLMFFFVINIGGVLQLIFDKGLLVIFIDGIQWLGICFGLFDWFMVFFVQGIGGGVNMVLLLVLQIGLMYLFFLLFEDFGYMVCVVFVMDCLMQVLGLLGKLFVLLIVGFGCNVLLIMGVWILDVQCEWLIIIMMVLFMFCGVCLVIFVVFVGVFFGQGGVLVIFFLYLFGIVVVIFIGLLFKYILMCGEVLLFVMELLLYYVLYFKSLLLQIWLCLCGFVVWVGKVIILVSLVIGGLNSIIFDGKLVQGDIGYFVLVSVSQCFILLLVLFGVQLDNWQVIVGLVIGVMVKEVVVGILNIFYIVEQIQGEVFDYEGYDLFG